MVRCPHQFLATLRMMVAGVSLAWLTGCAGSAAQKPSGKADRGQQNVSVAVAPVKKEDMPVILTGLGSVQATNTVTVKSRVDGQLIQVPIREGQEVKKGQLLAVIDPRPYEVQLSQAQATLFKDQSALTDAKANLDRFQGLFKEGVISRQQLDTQSSQVGQLEGAVRADQAQVDNAKLQLTYSRITSPIDGRVGLRQVDPGNMVHAGDANGLLVITQLQPIVVLFTLPEDNLPAVSKEMQRRKLPVDVYSRDDQTKLATGVLLTIDNQIDPQTGTGRLKAQFENRDHSLWPNQFVNARLLLETRKDSIVVPAAAIQRGPQGTYVYVVKPDKTTEMRTVNVALTQGETTAVDKGLSPGEQVVTDGADKLQTGSKVEVRGGGASSQNAAADSSGNNNNNTNEQSGPQPNPSGKRKRGGQQPGQPGQQQP